MARQVSELVEMGFSVKRARQAFQLTNDIGKAAELLAMQLDEDDDDFLGGAATGNLAVGDDGEGDEELALRMAISQSMRTVAHKRASKRS